MNWKLFVNSSSRRKGKKKCSGTPPILIGILFYAKARVFSPVNDYFLKLMLQAISRHTQIVQIVLCVIHTLLFFKSISISVFPFSVVCNDCFKIRKITAVNFAFLNIFEDFWASTVRCSKWIEKSNKASFRRFLKTQDSIISLFAFASSYISCKLLNIKEGPKWI